MAGTAHYNYPGVDIFDPTLLLNPGMIVIEEHSRIDSFCKLEGGRGLRIGEYVHVASFCHLNIGGGTLEIGDHCFFASGSKVVTGGNKDDGRSMSAVSPAELQVLKYGVVAFEPYSGMLTNATVLPGVTLHRGAVAAAGSVVTKDIPEWEIWAGAPAKFLRRRRTLVEEPVRKLLPIDEELAQRDADLRATATPYPNYLNQRMPR